MADSGCLRMSQILVNKASGDSLLQVLGNKARKNCQIVPVLPMYRGALKKTLQNKGFQTLHPLHFLGVNLPPPKFGGYGLTGHMATSVAIIVVPASSSSLPSLSCRHRPSPPPPPVLEILVLLGLVTPSFSSPSPSKNCSRRHHHSEEF